jgi:hypothetical protein
MTWYVISGHEEPIWSVNIGADTLEEAKRKNPVNYFFGRWKKKKWFWDKAGWKVRRKINAFMLRVKNILGAKHRDIGQQARDCLNCAASFVTEDDRLICTEKLKGKTEEESIVPDDGYCEEWN